MDQLEKVATAPKLRGKPSKIWVLITFVAGAVGALGAVAAGGHGTYDVEPFTLELRAKPADSGSTQLAVDPIPGLRTGRAEAPTHQSPLTVSVTVVGVSDGFLPTDAKTVATPHDVTTFMGDEAKTAVRSFAIKLAGLAFAGGAAVGAALSFIGMRWKRVIGAGLSGLLVFGIIGALMQQTYDSNKFLQTRFVIDQPAVPTTDTPTLLPSF